MQVSVYKHAFAILLIFAMSAIAIFGVHVGKTATEMTGCPFMPGVSLCPMGLVDHIEHWQQLLAVVLPLFASLVLLLIAMGRAIITLVSEWPRCRLRSAARLRHQYRHEHAPPLLNFLVSLFSDGILAPKIYA